MMRKQRRLIANNLAEIAIRHNATVEIHDEGRTTTLHCTWPGKVQCSLGISTLHDGGTLCSWFGAQEKLVDGHWFDSVNPHHRMKATLYRQDRDRFAEAFHRACEAVATGRAFGHGT